jgi:hypothetical protein
MEEIRARIGTDAARLERDGGAVEVGERLALGADVDRHAEGMGAAIDRRQTLARSFALVGGER